METVVSENIFYVVADKKTGFVTSRISVPRTMFPLDHPDGTILVVPEDGTPLIGEARLDLRKLRHPINFIPSIEVVKAKWQPDEVQADVRLQMRRDQLLEQIDTEFASQLAHLTGPLAALHTEKRRQAEAGGGTLVEDEGDRIAILVNAQSEDKAVAALDRVRRRLKDQVRMAATDDELSAIMAARDITKD